MGNSDDTRYFRNDYPHRVSTVGSATRIGAGKVARVEDPQEADRVALLPHVEEISREEFEEAVEAGYVRDGALPPDERPAPEATVGVVALSGETSAVQRVRQARSAPGGTVTTSDLPSEVPSDADEALVLAYLAKHGVPPAYQPTSGADVSGPQVPAQGSPVPAGQESPADPAEGGEGEGEVPVEQLKGKDLDAEANRLDIPGRSEMKAADKRKAIEKARAEEAKS